MDVLFLCFDILVFVSRLEVVSGGGLSKGCTVAKRLSSETRKKRDREKESKCEGESI